MSVSSFMGVFYLFDSLLDDIIFEKIEDLEKPKGQCD